MRSYVDRDHAARVLAEQVAEHAGSHPLLLAVPRGAVPIGARMAEILGGELDVVLVRKLGFPGNPELAAGSIDEAGVLHLSPEAAFIPGAASYLRHEAGAQLEVLRRRRELYTPVHAAADPAGRTVIVVDDGVATGYTMTAALASIRPRMPACLIAAVPVGSAEAVARLRTEADIVVCPIVDAQFRSVSGYYSSFPQVSDEEAVAVLRQAAA